MAASIGTIGAARSGMAGAPTHQERIANANRELNEQSLRFSRQSREHVDAALNTMMNTQVQLEEKKVGVGQVLLTTRAIGSIINTTA